MKIDKHTQGATLCVLLTKRPMTYMDMLLRCVSTSPWKRVTEYLRMHPELKLVKGERKGRVTWQVVRG